MSARFVATLLGALACAGCIQPSVLEEDRRRVAPDALAAAEPAAWRPARAEDLAGLFESASIEGEQAAAVWRIYYHFAADGTYTGAALVLGGPQPEFQTLTGAWTLAADGALELNGQSARAEAAPGLLRLESDGGRATFRRVALQ